MSETETTFETETETKSAKPKYMNTASKTIKKETWETMGEDLKEELVLFVLSRVAVPIFYVSIRQFSVQMLYGRYKRELMGAYPFLMSCELHYSIVMAEAFRKYTCPQIECEESERKLKRLLSVYKAYPATHPEKRSIGRQYNALVDIQTVLLKPQNDLIKLYKKVRKSKAVSRR